MNLTLDDMKAILPSPPSKSMLDQAREQAALLNMHITGQGLKDAITSMDFFEDEQKKNLRQRYSRSNKDIMGRLHRPIDKIFRAKGGSTVFNMPQGNVQDFAAYLSAIRNGQPLRKWVQMIALPAFQIDPMGLIFMELAPGKDAKGKLKPYPTYKSTNDIFDYKLNGRHLEYVIFKVGPKDAGSYINSGIAIADQMQLMIDERLKSLGDNKHQWFRVVDDTQDRIIEWDGNDGVTEITDQTLKNYFRSVPAIIISDIVSYSSNLFLSPDDLVVELMNDFLTDCSVFNIWKKLHAFPKQWRIRSICPTCQGNRKLQGRDCPDCSGTGYRTKSTPRDEIIVPMPEDGSKMPSEFAGFITPDVKGWELMTDEMDRLFLMAFETIWGTQPSQRTNGPDGGDKSATQAVMDVQAMNERLHDFREWGQGIETFIIDKCGLILYGSSYKGVANNWGNRYIVEGPDVIWEKYKNARSAGSPQATLDGLLRDYYESRYQTSPVDLEKALKLMRVEPFTHMTVAQVQQMTITDLDKCSKLYFSEWVSTKQDMEIILGTDQALRVDLLAFAQAKMEIIQAEELAANAAADGAGSDSLDAPVQRSTAARINT